MPNAAGKCVPVMPPEVVDQPSAASNPPAAALSEEAAARLSLAEDRMNLSISLPECLCMKHPRTVSYADVGDPEGYVAFLMLGVDSHRYMSLLLDKPAMARGVRLICLDRPGRGNTSDYEDERANRVLEFPDILRRFCRAAGIETFSLLGQSLGASYALRCAQEMPDMVATTVYLISPWVSLSVPGSSRALAAVEKLPTWLIKAGMAMGTAMPRLLASSGSLGLMAKGCSEEECILFASRTMAEVFKTVGKVHEASHGVILDAVAALEKDQPLGFDYRDVSMPVHVFHGRADHMVPFPAVQWMSEEMPACTLSVKMGGTHALLMDSAVLDCVLECMSEDFKHFKAHAEDTTTGFAANGREPPFSFPAHTQRFQAEGPLRVRGGILFKTWEDRHFILEGYELHELEGPRSATALHVVDLRGTVARVPMDAAQTLPVNPRERVFPFKLVDPKHRVLYELGASTTGDRAFWVETLTKASRYTMGSGDEQRQGALSRRFLITTRAGSRRGMGDGIGGCASGHGPGSTTRRQSAPSSSLWAPSNDKLAASPPPPGEWKSTHGRRIVRTRTPGDVVSRRSVSRDLLHGTPFRPRNSLSGWTWPSDSAEKPTSPQ